MRRLWTAVVVLSLVSGGTAPALETGARDPELAAGIAAVAAKDYNSAIGTLSQVVRRLGPDPARKDDLVAAYLHLGVAFAGLGQESPARSQFAQALLRKPDVRLGVKEAPELAKKLFVEAQREAAPVIAVAEQQKKKSSRLPLVLAGVAAVGAGGAVVANAGGSPTKTGPPPPTNVEPSRIFLFSGLTGLPYLSLESGTPGSGSTISVASTRPRFVFRTSASPAAYPRVKVTVSLETIDRGVCWFAESGPFALTVSGVAEVVVDGFAPTPLCAPPFTTLAMSVRLMNLDTGQQISLSSYTGGYKVVP